jgi:hypothetical protein
MAMRSRGARFADPARWAELNGTKAADASFGFQRCAAAQTIPDEWSVTGRYPTSTAGLVMRTWHLVRKSSTDEMRV